MRGQLFAKACECPADQGFYGFGADLQFLRYFVVFLPFNPFQQVSTAALGRQVTDDVLYLLV